MECSLATKLEQIYKWLDEFQVSAGVPCSRLVVNKTEELINKEPDIADLDSDDCLESANRLSWLALHVQRVLNELQTRFDALTETIDKLVAPIVAANQVYGKEERKAQRRLAINQHDAAQTLETERVKTELKIKRLQFIPGRLDAIARCYLSASYAKKGVKGEPSQFYS